MKNNIGIFTLCGNDNYGNKLQNYAIVQFLKRNGYDAETIWVENPYIASNLRQTKRYIKRLINDYIIFYSRRKYFIKFNKYLNIKKRIIFNNDFKKIEKRYNSFLVGSDQVWNNAYFNNDSIYFLSESKKNNIAFSASFGVSNVPKNCYERYKNGLNNFDYISVREDRGKELVFELTGRKDVEVLVDPTMLLTSEDWDKIVNRPKKLTSKKYILNYFLGNLSEEKEKEIERIARENNCDVINLLDKNNSLYNTGPSEFLYLEKNAFLICTDSFHSSVFAILYNRPFIVFERDQNRIESMNSRIDTLLSKFKLEDRKYNGKNITKDNLEHDYSEAYKILDIEREKSEKFIKKALNK